MRGLRREVAPAPCSVEFFLGVFGSLFNVKYCFLSSPLSSGVGKDIV